MVLLGKTPENVLQEELLREKAEVLARAGEQVASLIEALRDLQKDIESLLDRIHGDDPEKAVAGNGEADVVLARQLWMEEINVKISRYNNLREDAKLRYHYLIITREALGMRRHHWVEEMYKIPPRKAYLHNL